ncbi:hypothetical protein AYL99_05602 [Fonsecaea erecta]|uniref:Uncharacterized protein n=1 Tax=Fonsecaea erecta TaxID=1367422 RepID=A0A178ZLD3_9EURO|nr:hypothetical protein AYL99_05602 [Fonsecaea erecta]OAP60600.1 hypothetical protein AYL99_05602 [Fonsecaea erecta]
MRPLSSSAALVVSFLSTLSVVVCLLYAASVSSSISTSPSTSTSANKTTLHVTALTNHAAPPYLARVQCWALAAPFAVYPTVGRAVDLGDVDNVTYVVLPPRSGEGWHRPPHAMFFVLLSGLAQVYVPRRRHLLAGDGLGNGEAVGGRGDHVHVHVHGNDYDYDDDDESGYERRFESSGSRLDLGLDFELDHDKDGGGGDHHQNQQQQPLLPGQQRHPHPDDPAWETITITPGSPQQILVAADTDPRARGHLTFYPGDGETVALQIPFSRDAAEGPAHAVVHEGACRGDE